jgi:hypothetical protein
MIQAALEIVQVESRCVEQEVLILSELFQSMGRTLNPGHHTFQGR